MSGSFFDVMSHMGTVKKIGEEYYIEFEARGLKYQQKAGTDKAEALRLLAEVEGKIAKGQMNTLVRDIDADIFFKDFSEYARTRHSLRTMKRFEKLLAHFQEFLNDEHPKVKKLSQVTPVILEQYKIYLQKKARLPGRPANKAKIINLGFFLLGDVFQYAIKSGYLNDNPSLHVELMKIPARSRPRGLTEFEIKTLGQKSSPLLSKVIEFILLTGVRWSELIQIRWKDVDRDNQVIRVSSPSATQRVVPFTLPIKELLESLASKKVDASSPVFLCPPDTKSFCLQFRELLYNCGLANKVTTDCLHHTFAIGLLKREVPLADLYKYLGLPDIGRAMIYASFIPVKKSGLYEN